MDIIIFTSDSYSVHQYLSIDTNIDHLCWYLKNINFSACPLTAFGIPAHGYNCFKWPQITFIISPFDFSCRLRCEKWYYMPYLVENRDFGHIGHVSSLSGGQITWPSARNIFFLFANDSTPSKRYIYIYYTTKSAKWFPRYVGFRIWRVRGVNHPPKGGKRGRKIGTRLDSVYWTPIGPKKLEVPKLTCKMS